MQALFRIIVFVIVFKVTYWMGSLVPEHADARLLFSDNNVILGCLVFCLAYVFYLFVGLIGFFIFGDLEAVEEYNKEVDKDVN